MGKDSVNMITDDRHSKDLLAPGDFSQYAPGNFSQNPAG